MAAPTIAAGYTSGADAANTTSTPVTAPTNVSGQRIYVAVVSDAASDVMDLSGFSKKYDNVDVVAAATFSLFYKTSSGSEPGSYTVTGTVSERRTWIAFAVDNDNGFDSTASNASGTGTTAACNFATTTQNNCLLVNVVAVDSSAGDNTPHTPASMTKLTDKFGSSAGGISVNYEAATTAGLWPSGASVSLNASDQWLSVAFAIAPVADLMTHPNPKPITSKTLARPYLRI